MLELIDLGFACQQASERTELKPKQLFQRFLSEVALFSSAIRTSHLISNAWTALGLHGCAVKDWVRSFRSWQEAVCVFHGALVMDVAGAVEEQM